MSNFDQMRLAVEGLSGGKNTILLDDVGMPSYMVAIPQMRVSDLITGGTQDVHDAFILNGVHKDVVYIGKYQSVIVNNRAYSLPFKNPATIAFDAARSRCRDKGNGWHLPTNALYAAIALWCKRNETMPRGNNNFGRDIDAPHETGIPCRPRDADGRVLAVATGSGPNSWYHDHNAATGIADLNGNVAEWCGGLRIVSGELQIIPHANAMDDRFTGSQDIQAPTSSLWQAIMPNGTLVAPGTPGTLKWDWVSSQIRLSTEITVQANSSRSATFETMTLASGVTPPQLLTRLALHPTVGETGYAADRVWMNNGDGLELLPTRGGGWTAGAGAGVFSLNLHGVRSFTSTLRGFRCAFVS